MNHIIKEFLYEKGMLYAIENQEDGTTFFRSGLTYNDGMRFHIVFICSFEENYFEIVAAADKEFSPKYQEKVLSFYNLLAQQKTPIIHFHTKEGMVAGKYGFQLMNGEVFTIERVEEMLETLLDDVSEIFMVIEDYYGE